MEDRLLNDAPESQVALLQFYTTLLRRWTVGLLSSDQLPAPAHASTSISRLIQHVNKLSLTLLQTLPAVSTECTILSFYEQVAAMGSNPGLLRHVAIAIPPAALVYVSHFSQSAAVASRLYAILAAYRKMLEIALSHPPNKQQRDLQVDGVNLFNGFLKDICNCLWRERAFTTTDANALGCRMPESMVPCLSAYISSLDRDLSLSMAFGLSHSPTLCLQSITYLRQLEDAETETAEGGIRKRHAGPVTQNSLTRLANEGGLSLSWADYRTGILGHLEGCGLAGAPELMYNTMRNLKNARSA